MNRRNPTRISQLALGISLALAGGSVMAAAYKIPENSLNSTALSAAYVANAHGADASYYNPAAMVFNEGGASFEADLTGIHLTSIKYTETTVAPIPNDSSKIENFLIPTLHYVSPAYGNARFGISVVAPAGLSKRWSVTGKASAEEFTLKTVEINPTLGYKLSDNLSVGIGARVIYSDGVVKSDANPLGTNLVRNLTGDSFDFGYNLALHFKPTDTLDLSATYRSKIDLTVEGDAALTGPLGGTYNGGARVSVPVPATLALAAALDVTDQTTVEFVYERNYWSAYKQLDFNYDTALAADLTAFDTPVPKNWKDSNTYRLGVTHKLDSKWTLMGAVAIDKTPVPKRYLGFELPDSDAKIISFGARYKYSDKMDIGAAVLYDKKDKLTLTAADGNTGTGLTGAVFEDASAYLVTVGIEYKF